MEVWIHKKKRAIRLMNNNVLWKGQSLVTNKEKTAWCFLEKKSKKKRKSIMTKRMRSQIRKRKKKIRNLKHKNQGRR